MRALVQEYTTRHDADKALEFCTSASESWRIVLGVDVSRRALFLKLLAQANGQDDFPNTSPFYEIKKLDVDARVASLALAARDKGVWIDGPKGLHARTALSLGIFDAFLEGENDPRLLQLALGNLSEGVHVALYDELIRILEPGLNEEARRAWRRLSTKAHAHSTQGASDKITKSDHRSARLLITSKPKGAIHSTVKIPPLKRAKKTHHPQVRTLFAP